MPGLTRSISCLWICGTAGQEDNIGRLESPIQTAPGIGSIS